MSSLTASVRQFLLLTFEHADYFAVRVRHAEISLDLAKARVEHAQQYGTFEECQNAIIDYNIACANLQFYQNHLQNILKDAPQLGELVQAQLQHVRPSKRVWLPPNLASMKRRL